ncbi:MAG: TolC family protein, partial [Alistipes sp.]|nr:TolC family protein [Alistipes sp.]
HYAVEAAAAGVGTARSNRFPSIPLTGSGGRFGAKFKELFSENLWSWSATGSLVQPLFSFGRLSRREQIARSAYNESLRQYEQTVLEALEQVESALTAISTTNRQTERYAEYVAANKRIANLTEQLYRIGMSNYLDVISTEQTWYTSQLTLIELMIQQRINYSTLVMALGEGWQGL